MFESNRRNDFLFLTNYKLNTFKKIYHSIYVTKIKSEVVIRNILNDANDFPDSVPVEDYWSLLTFKKYN